jgi:hypothetical protein
MMKRGRPSDPYAMWLCWELASELTGDATLSAQFLPQHKQRERSAGGFAIVAKWLHMTPDAVERQVSKARKRRDTEGGLQEYHDWLNHREKQWWFYHTVRVEKRELMPAYVGETNGDTLIRTRITREEIEAYVTKAQRRLKDEGARGEHDYQDWLALYERRDEKGRSMPLVYCPLPSDHPAAIAIDEARAANGLRNGLSTRGRPRRAN